MVNFLQWTNCFCRARPRVAWAALWALAFILLMAMQATAASVEAALDQSSINVGETATLSLKIEGGESSPPNPPVIDGLSVNYAGEQRNFVMVNGQTSSHLTFNYSVTPARLGDFTIPAIKVDINGTRITSLPLKLKVLKGNTSSSDGTPEPAFVKLNIPKKEIYLGAVLPIEVLLYHQYANDIQLPQLASDGFLAGTMPNQPQQTTMNSNNTKYNVYIFRVPVTATRTGSLKLGPATDTLTVFLGQPQRDVFGRINFSQSRRATLTSDAPEIRVLPVPTSNAPASFSGAIGRFGLAMFEAGPTTVAVGDPITLKIRINGHGSIESLTLPNSQPEWREFKTYPASSKLESNDPMRVDGAKYFEQVITPQNAEVKEIPAFAFSYFDPDQKTFKTLTHPPIPLTVRPTVATPQPTIISTAAPPAEAPPPAQEIVHIKPQLGTLRAISPPLIRQPGFLALQLIAPLLWIGSVIWRRQKESLANNPQLRRQREVARVIQNGLKELAQQAQANKPEEFYATVFHLLQEQLGERLDLPASAITEAVLENLPADAETLALFHELFHICNQYRYAPQRTGQELASLIPKVQSALQSLQKICATKTPAKKAVLQSLSCLLLLFATGELRAEDLSAGFNQANKLYEQNKFAEAADAYEKLIHTGSVSPALYFNLGNAYFKAGQTGRAIVAYRQAETISPRDPAVRANLRFARNQVSNGNPALPGSRWTRWLRTLTLNEWSVAASVTLAVFFLLLAARQIWPNAKKVFSGYTAALGMGCGLLIGSLLFAAEDQLGTQASVVIVPEAVVPARAFG